MTLKVLRPVQVTSLSAWVQFVEQDELIQVPIQNGRSVQSKNIEKLFTSHGISKTVLYRGPVKVFFI